MPKKKVVKDYSRLTANHLQQLKKELDEKEAIQKLNKIHSENLRRQYRNNAVNEYTRIRDYLDAAGPPGTRDVHHLEMKLDGLKNKIEKFKIVYFFNINIII